MFCINKISKFTTINVSPSWGFVSRPPSPLGSNLGVFEPAMAERLAGARLGLALGSVDRRLDDVIRTYVLEAGQAAKGRCFHWYSRTAGVSNWSQHLTGQNCKRCPNTVNWALNLKPYKWQPEERKRKRDLPAKWPCKRSVSSADLMLGG